MKSISYLYKHNLLNTFGFNFQNPLPEGGTLVQLQAFVDVDPLDTDDHCFWMMLFESMNPPYDTYFVNRWRERLCVSPEDTNHLIHNLTAHVEVKENYYFGWTCEMNNKCPVYFDDDDDVIPHEIRYVGAGFIPQPGQGIAIGHQKYEVWSIGVNVTVEG